MQSLMQFLPVILVLTNSVFVMADTSTSNLVGKDWNKIRPNRCATEGVINSPIANRSYAILKKNGNRLFVLKKGQLLLDTSQVKSLSSDKETLKQQKELRAKVLPILGVVDLGNREDEAFGGPSISEEISCQASSKLHLDPGDFIIANVKLSKIKVDGTFPAERAWVWSEKEQHFKMLSDLSIVSCSLDIHGDYPPSDWIVDYSKNRSFNPCDAN